MVLKTDEKLSGTPSGRIRHNKLIEWGLLILRLEFKDLYRRIKYHLSDKGAGVYKYKNYEEYRATQINGNLEKIDNTWVAEENIHFLSDYLKRNIKIIEFGICHGTRRGSEQAWFRKYLGVNVIGTEISPTATNFPDTIEWDFHDVKKEWINNVDFIYSNSFDHSYKPEVCLDSWMSCIKKSGICILEWTIGHIPHSKLDPFGATKRSYKKLIKRKYNLVEILRGGYVGGKKDKRAYFFIIKHKSNKS